MIRFIPFHIKFPEQRETDFCNNMNYERTVLRCVRPGCKKIDTDISVNGKDARFFTFQIVNPCCDAFKERLEKILVKF